MNGTERTRLGDRFAAAALLLAAVAAAAGVVVADLYRDNEAWVRQARATDLVTLLAAVPILAVSLWRVRAGSAAARVLVSGSLGYLVYSYAIFAFAVAINPMTPLHIAILSLSTWALVLSVSGLDRGSLDSIGAHLPRRTTGISLTIISLLFGSLWLGQIAGAITTGRPPVEVARLGLPTNPVYVLDLAFALPLLALAGISHLRRARGSGAMAVAMLVWTAVMGLSILAIFGFDAAAGQPVEPVVVAVIGAITGTAAVLALTGLLPRGAEHLFTSAARGGRNGGRLDRDLADQAPVRSVGGQRP